MGNLLLLFGTFWVDVSNVYNLASSILTEILDQAKTNIGVIIAISQFTIRLQPFTGSTWQTFFTTFFIIIVVSSPNLWQNLPQGYDEPFSNFYASFHICVLFRQFITNQKEQFIKGTYRHPVVLEKLIWVFPMITKHNVELPSSQPIC